MSYVEDNLIDTVLTEAQSEWEEDGVLSLSTIGQLVELGVNVSWVENQFDQGIDADQMVRMVLM